MDKGTNLDIGPAGGMDAASSSKGDDPAVKETDNSSSKSSEKSENKPKGPDYDEKSGAKPNFKDLLRVFGLTTLADRIILGLAILGQLGTGATLPLMIVVFGGLIGDFSDVGKLAEEDLTNPGKVVDDFRKTINTSVLYLVYIFIGRYVLGYFSMLSFRMIGLRISSRIRYEYLTALFALPVSVLDTVPTGQTSTTITSTANLLQLGISDKLGTLIQFSATMITAIIIAFTFSWALTLATSSVLIFIGVIYSFTVPLTMKLNKEVTFADDKAASIAGEALASIRMILASGAESRVSRRYSGWVEESRKRGRKLDVVQGVMFSPVFFGVYGVFALAFYLGFKLYISGKGSVDDIGVIIIVIMSVMMMVFGVSQTAAPIVNLGKAATAASDFYAVIDAPKPNKLGLKDPDVSPQADIVLDSVNFAYPSRPRSKVLDGLSARFKAGKITAIVGASGSGKSTIVGLLQRWYELNDRNQVVIPKSFVKDEKAEKEKEKEKEKENENEASKSAEAIEDSKPLVPISGTVSVGDHNIDDLDLKWWRSQIGLVQQEPYIFNDTIYKNVEYGLIGSKFENEPEEVKRQLVVEACKEAFADEYISKLPDGYETSVGDAGIKLSGGQRQRLAIARSIIKRPTILILDEATSAIDVKGERLVQAALDKVSEGRTTITIAHRLSTIKKADNILVMQKGKVVEEGNHESLLDNVNGPYWSLVNAQKLTMGDSYAEESDLVEEKQEALAKIMSAASGTAATASEEQYKPKGFWGSFGLLLGEQNSQFRWYIILLIGCLMAASAYPLQAYLMAKVISIANLPKAELGAAASHWSLMFFFLALGVGSAYFTMGASSNVISVNIASTYRQEYFESILAKPVKFYDAEENSSGSLGSRVSNDPTQLQQLLGINMGVVLIAGLNLLGSSILGFIFGWKLTIVTLFVVCPLVIAAGFFRVRFELEFEAMNQAVFADSSKFAAESITAFRTVTSLTLEDMICERYNGLLQGHVKAAFDKAKWSMLLFAASDSITLPCMALIFWYGGKLLLAGEYTVFEFFVVYTAVFNGAEGAGSLLSFGPNVAQATAAANRILSFRIREKDIRTGSLELEDTTGGVKIELKDVYFKYPTRDVPIFTGLNLTVEKGQFAALVGPSGCGKTSIVSLLERFYEIQRGKILMNGTDVTELDIKGYRKSISLVAQEPTLFQGTIRENILLGVDENTPNETLFKACRDAEIHDFISSLPQGYETDVGNKGVALSGGQKQRISIARALIRGPKILLLDEATSSLDSESEKLVQAAFERAAEGRTMVVVAHRLATIQNANVIFVLGDGKVLEKGNHQELLSKRGVYYQMCQSQALDR